MGPNVVSREWSVLGFPFRRPSYSCSITAIALADGEAKVKTLESIDKTDTIDSSWAIDRDSSGAESTSTMTIYMCKRIADLEHTKKFYFRDETAQFRKIANNHFACTGQMLRTTMSFLGLESKNYTYYRNRNPVCIFKLSGVQGFER